jgi:hypothetical protein
MILWAHSTNEVVFAAANLIVAQPSPSSSSGGSGGSGGGYAAATQWPTGSSPTHGPDQNDDDLAAEWARDSSAAAGLVHGGGRGGGCGNQQRLFIGHTAWVTAMALGGEGKLLASGQEGRQPVVRLWDFETGDCLAILCGEFAFCRVARWRG